MWQARNKVDLIIEVWERLDCESIGRTELEAIEAVVEDVYGKSAVDSPMIVARLLADEGADLRHAEIMKLHVERASDRPYDAAFRNLIDITDLAAAERSIRDLENLRRKYKAEGDKDGLRRIRETAIDARQKATEASVKPKIDDQHKKVVEEISAWLRVWLETPEVFDSWLSLRRSSPGFTEDFGESVGDSP
jgi:hypothetical protein